MLLLHSVTVKRAYPFGGRWAASGIWPCHSSSWGVSSTCVVTRRLALALFEESRSLFRDLQDAWGSAITLIGQGFVSGRRGDYATARAHLTEALTSWQDQQDKVSKTDALSLLGEVIQRQGEPKQASGVYVECLLLSRELGDKARCALILRRLGSVAQLLGQYDRAVQLFAAAAAVGTQPGAPYSLRWLTPLNRNERLPRCAPW